MKQYYVYVRCQFAYLRSSEAASRMCKLTFNVLGSHHPYLMSSKDLLIMAMATKQCSHYRPLLR